MTSSPALDLNQPGERTLVATGETLLVSADA
jgi:hypothetical protein